MSMFIRFNSCLVKRTTGTCISKRNYTKCFRQKESVPLLHCIQSYAAVSFIPWFSLFSLACLPVLCNVFKRVQVRNLCVKHTVSQFKEKQLLQNDYN